MKNKAGSLLLLVVLSACQVGPRLETFEPAHQPEGVLATLDLVDGLVRGDRIEGELLEVRDDGLLLNVAPASETPARDRRVTFVDFSRIDRLRIAQRPGWVSDLDTAKRDKLALLSRFPQGLSPELLDALLTAQEQDTVAVAGE